MNLAEAFINGARKYLPTPFTIAVLLTLITFAAAIALTRPAGTSVPAYTLDVVGFWEQGFWGLLTFTLQMMLILVLGHTLALTKPVNWLIEQLARYCTTTPRAALIVSFSTIVVALFNWGLGLIFGAIFARQVGEYAKTKGYKINYPLIGACGYVGLMVWHGGISGSAPLDVATEGHKLSAVMGIIPTTDTLYSNMNLTAIALCLVVLPAVMYVVGKYAPATNIRLPRNKKPNLHKPELVGAEKLDNSLFFGLAIGACFVAYAAYMAFGTAQGGFKFLNLNNINFLLFGLGLLLHGRVVAFVAAFEKAIRGASGIMLQFPLYAGIIGIMNASGLLVLFAQFFIDSSTPNTFPLFTFISAGIINIFVPSGGGQWAVQGPVIVQASQQLGIPLAKNVMALAYGDQLTNMLQPFWALPLLGITGLKAQEILPYTVLLFICGFVIFGTVLMIF